MQGRGEGVCGGLALALRCAHARAARSAAASAATAGAALQAAPAVQVPQPTRTGQGLPANHILGGPRAGAWLTRTPRIRVIGLACPSESGDAGGRRAQRRSP